MGVKLEVTDTAQMRYDLAMYAAELEAAARPVRCNEFFTMPMQPQQREAINRNLNQWARQYAASSGKVKAL